MAGFSSSSSSWYDAEEEVQLCNDDGFDNKRRTRLTTQQPPPIHSQPSNPQPQLKRRKKNTLKKLRDKYQKEILHWELLSNTLTDMEHKAENQQSQIQNQTCSSSYVQESGLQPLLAEVLVQGGEAQEAIIKNAFSLCDLANAFCDMEKERIKESVFHLPIWGSPRSLLASLDDDLGLL